MKNSLTNPISLCRVNPNYYGFLFKLLKQRPRVVNISHLKMPSFSKHVRFCNSNPYMRWYIILHNVKPVGHIYLTHKNEIGVFVLKEFQHRGIGQKAIKLMIEDLSLFTLYANIAPANIKSQNLFKKFGFKLVQYTFKRLPQSSKK